MADDSPTALPTAEPSTRSLSSSDEAEGEREFSNYSVWRTPPKLEPFIYPEESIEMDVEPEWELGLDVLQIDSPNNIVEEPVAIAKLSDCKPEQPKHEVKKDASRQSSTQSSDTSTNLKSLSEQMRLDAYLKRMAEEEEMRKRQEELVVAQPYVKNDPPQRLQFEEMNLENEDLNFSPVNVPWKETHVHSDSKQPDKKPPPLVEPKQSKPIDLKIERGVLLSESSQESNENPTVISDFMKHDSKTSKFLPSRSTKSTRKPTTSTSKKILRSMSFRRARSSSTAGSASVRAAAVQRSLSAGFESEESKRMTFVLKGGLSHAVNAVATTCQQHLRVGIFKRHSGDKLRVECRDESERQLTLSVGFTEQVGMNRKKMTMVDVRPSRKDKGNWSLSQMTEFYHKLVTQLDVDGHTVVSTDTRSNRNASRLR